MARQIRTVNPLTISNIDAAVRALKEAEQLLSKAGAVKTRWKVKSALKSAQGAKRHALRAAFRHEGLVGVEALLARTNS